MVDIEASRQLHTNMFQENIKFPHFLDLQIAKNSGQKNKKI